MEHESICTRVGQLTSQASRKAGTTNLHIDTSDAVNILVYVGIGGLGEDGSGKDEEIQRKNVAQCNAFQVTHSLFWSCT